MSVRLCVFENLDERSQRRAVNKVQLGAIEYNIRGILPVCRNYVGIKLVRISRIDISAQSDSQFPRFRALDFHFLHAENLPFTVL